MVRDRSHVVVGEHLRRREGLKRFSPEHLRVFAVTWHISEVNNGGHDQFYFNDTGIVRRDALAGYKAIGLNEAADIVEQSADDIMGGNPSLDRATRMNQLEQNLNFEETDHRFYKLQETTDFEKAIMT